HGVLQLPFQPPALPRRKSSRTAADQCGTPARRAGAEFASSLLAIRGPNAASQRVRRSPPNSIPTNAARRCSALPEPLSPRPRALFRRNSGTPLWTRSITQEARILFREKRFARRGTLAVLR